MPSLTLPFSPNAILAELARRNLREYVKMAWPVVEPATEYVPGWHIDCICDHLQAVTDGHIQNLLINIPPRHMKSLTVSVFWPTWEWASKPHTRWIYSSYAQSLSIRDSLKCRRLIESPWYQRMYGNVYQLTGDQNMKTRFENDKTGYRIASSVDGSNTGEGGDRIVADDPHNVKDTESDIVREHVLIWWDEVMSTRLNNQDTGAKVIVMQRVHEADLSGHVLERGNYHHLCLPARYEKKIVVEGVSVERRHLEAPGDSDNGASGDSSASFDVDNGGSLGGTPLGVVNTSAPGSVAGRDQEMGAPAQASNAGRDPIQPHLACRWGSDPRTEEGELLWPGRFSDESLTALEKEMGSYAVAGQFQQRPVPRSGAIFKSEYFRPLPANFDVPGEDGRSFRSKLTKIQFWDLGFSEADAADYTACTTIGVDREYNIFILHAWRARIDEVKLPNEIANIIEITRPHMVAIEEAAFKQATTQAVVADLHKILAVRKIATAVRGVPVTKDKVFRAYLPATRGEAGQLYADRTAPWWPAYEGEMLVFPRGRNDDWVDSLAGATTTAVTVLDLMPDDQKQEYRMGGGKAPQKPDRLKEMIQEMRRNRWELVTKGKR